MDTHPPTQHNPQGHRNNFISLVCKQVSFVCKRPVLRKRDPSTHFIKPGSSRAHTATHARTHRHTHIDTHTQTHRHCCHSFAPAEEETKQTYTKETYTRTKKTYTRTKQKYFCFVDTRETYLYACSYTCFRV